MSTADAELITSDPTYHRVGSLATLQAGEHIGATIDGQTVAVFLVDGDVIATQGTCPHASGPLHEGEVDGRNLTCPWHGYQYDVQTGRLLLDPSARLPSYPVEVRAGEVYLQIPVLVRDPVTISLADLFAPVQAPHVLAANEFRVADLKPGEAKKIELDGEPVAVYNVDGSFYATHDECTHVGGPLSEGKLEGVKIICPWHASCFDVTNGQVLCGPAKVPVRTYKVTVMGDTGRITLE